MREAVLDVAARQVETGVDVISDGEMSKVAFNSYASQRLSGLGGACERRPSTEEAMFPDLGEYLLPQHGVAGNQFPVCTGPLEYTARRRSSATSTTCASPSRNRNRWRCS